MNAEYQRLLRDPRWQKRRLEVLNMAEWKCEDCGDGKESLEIHHCAYRADTDPWEYGDNLLMCLCMRCHRKRQESERDFRVEIGKITRKVPLKCLEMVMGEILKYARVITFTDACSKSEQIVGAVVRRCEVVIRRGLKMGVTLKMKNGKITINNSHCPRDFLEIIEDNTEMLIWYYTVHCAEDCGAEPPPLPERRYVDYYAD
jgi:hypothetical protein